MKNRVLAVAFCAFAPLAFGEETTLLVTQSNREPIGMRAYTQMGVAESLIGVDAKGELIPRIAQKWSVNNEKSVWTIRLRRGLKFSNGKPVTAKAVLNALEIARKKDTPLKQAPISTIEIKNGRINFTMYRAYSQLPAMLAHPSSAILAPESYDKKGDIITPIGTGAFHIDSQTTDSFVTVRNRHYHGKKHPIDSATYRLAYLTEVENALHDGSYDGVLSLGLAVNEVSRLSRAKQVKKFSHIAPRVILLTLNHRNAFLKDNDVRHALSLALDRRGMATLLLRAPNINTTQLFPPTLSQWHDSELIPFEFDIDGAKARLRRAGFAFDKSGYAIRNGRYLELTLQTENRPELLAFQGVLKTQLQKIGVKLVISDFADTERAFKENALHLLVAFKDYSESLSPLADLSAEMKNIGWFNKGFESAINALKLDNSDKRAKEHRAYMVKTLHEVLPIIPLVWMNETVVASARMQSVMVDPFRVDYQLDALKIAPKPELTTEEKQALLDKQEESKAYIKLLFQVRRIEGQWQVSGAKARQFVWMEEDN